jgi:hypothetical protein
MNEATTTAREYVSARTPEKKKKRQKDVSMIYIGIVRARLLCRHVQLAGQFNFELLWVAGKCKYITFQFLQPSTTHFELLNLNPMSFLLFYICS